MTRMTQSTRIDSDGGNASASELAMEAGHRTKVKKEAEVDAEGCDVAAELSAGALGQAFGRLWFDDDPAFDEHVDAMKANLLAPEGDDDRVFAIDLEPSASHRDLECPRIERLDEAVSQLVIHLEEASNNGVAELLFYDDRV